MNMQSEEHELDINEIEHFKSIMKKLNLLRKERKNCDLVISVEEKTIHVNRDVVCAASEYFDAMFSHDTIEKKEGIVKMKDIQYSAAEKCIDFMYTGKLSVSVDQCDEILYSANLMQLHEVCEKITFFLQCHLAINTFFEIRRIAIKFSIESLKGLCNKFAILNIAALSRLNEFNDIDFCYLKSLISADRSVIRTIRMEDVKLGITIQWIKAEENDRMKHLIDLLNEIDFSKLTLEYCKYLVDEEPLCRTSNDLVRMLFSAVVQKQGISSHGLPDVSLHYGYKQPQNALIIFNEEEENVLAYFPSQAVNKSLAKYHDSIKETDFVACTSRNTVFIFLNNRKVYYFVIDNPEWQCAPEMLHSHGDLLRCAMHNDHVYVGGESYLEKWDLQKISKWENVDLDGNICDNTAIIEFQDSLYLIGGIDKAGNAIKEVVRKHPYTKWGSISSMNTARKQACVIVYEGNIYVSDSSYQSSQPCNFEIYNSETNLWTNLIISESPVGFFSLQLVSNQIIAVEKESIKSYDSNEKCWNEIKNCLPKNIWVFGTTTAFISGCI